MSDGTQLRHYQAEGSSCGKVLVVSSLINRFYVLDLLPQVSVINLLNHHGLDVYVLDWGAPGLRGQTRTFADYVHGFVPWALARIQERDPGPVHLKGYCMGGTLTAMAAALHPEHVQTLVTLASPIDFHKSGIPAF